MKYPTQLLISIPPVLPSPFLRRALPPLAPLFCNNSAPQSFVFNSLQPLFRKHPGVGYLSAPFDLPDLQTFGRSDLRPLFFWRFVFIILRFPLHARSQQRPFIFIHLQIPFRATALFSHPYKTLGCHPLTFNFQLSTLSTVDCRPLRSRAAPAQKGRLR